METDKRVVRAYFLHNANCRANTPKYMTEARAEYKRRQKEVLDAQITRQQAKYEDMRKTDQTKPAPNPTSMEKVEQMSLYNYL